MLSCLRPTGGQAVPSGLSISRSSIFSLRTRSIGRKSPSNTLSDRSDVDGHKHKAKAGNYLLSVSGTCHGNPHRLQRRKSFATRCNFRPPNWVPEPVSILPIPRDCVATQECVGDNAKGPKLTAAKPDTKVRCGRGGTCRVSRTESTSANQSGEGTCMEPGDLSGPKTIG